MDFYIKTILLFGLIVQFSQSEEIFVQTDTLKLATITLSKNYCKAITENKQLCKSKKLNYIDYKDTDLPDFLEGLKTHISPSIKAYQDEKLKASTLLDINESDGEITGEWYNETSIELAAKTPTTYTLSHTYSGYTGGAHGYYGVSFKNYYIQSQKELTLKDLFLADFNQPLLHIARSHYKRTHGLKEKQSLTDEGWFEDKFELAKEFAITTQGIYFVYNQYEIKSYASGITTFMLPYYKLHSIINPKGPLHFVLKNPHTFHTSFYEKENSFIDIKTKRNTNNSITITASMKNLSYLSQAWFSLSFPQIHNKKQILKMQKQGFSSLQSYSKGSKIYHNQYKKAVRSSYLLVEASNKNWNNDKVHTVILTLNVPKQSKELIVDIRSTLKYKHKSIMLPNEDEGVKGQQGFKNYRIFIGL